MAGIGEKDAGATHGERADMAAAHAAADHDALRVVPAFEGEEALRHAGERVRELLDGGMDEARGNGIGPLQDVVELLPC